MARDTLTKRLYSIEKIAAMRNEQKQREELRRMMANLRTSVMFETASKEEAKRLLELCEQARAGIISLGQITEHFVQAEKSGVTIQGVPEIRHTCAFEDGITLQKRRAAELKLKWSHLQKKKATT